MKLLFYILLLIHTASLAQSTFFVEIGANQVWGKFQGEKAEIPVQTRRTLSPTIGFGFFIDPSLKSRNFYCLNIAFSQLKYGFDAGLRSTTSGRFLVLAEAKFGHRFPIGKESTLNVTVGLIQGITKRTENYVNWRDSTHNDNLKYTNKIATIAPTFVSIGSSFSFHLQKRVLDIGLTINLGIFQFFVGEFDRTKNNINSQARFTSNGSHALLSFKIFKKKKLTYQCFSKLFN
jgi:hypothetical protein